MTLLFDLQKVASHRTCACVCPQHADAHSDPGKTSSSSKRCERSANALGLRSHEDQGGCPPALAGGLHLWK